MVPSVFRDFSPTCFNPRVVSIGPLHREDKNLQEFERQKATSVYDLLHRVDDSKWGTLKACVQKVNDSIDRIRGCYAGMKTYTDDELAEIMVMDGCFILEFIYNVSKSRPTVQNMLLQQPVIYDLVLLENQIPFFVLDNIFQCTIVKLGVEDSLQKFIFPVLKLLHLFDAELKIGKLGTTDDHIHILGLVHECYLPPSEILSDFSSSTIHSAVELDWAGVKFRPNRDADWSMAMEVRLHRFPFLSWYWSKPTFRMPVLHIHDYTEVILRNLMAYEQSYLGCNYVTSYVIAMDMLVNTQEDVAMLVKSKVLVNNLGSNDEAANLLNSMCKEVAWVHFFYSKEWKILDSYCNGYWPKNVAWLRRTYFSSPWNIIALLAGIILFALTVVQTIFSIKGD